MAAPYLIVIGGSAGGLQPVLTLLPELSADLNAAIIIVLHRQNHNSSLLPELLAAKTTWTVKEAAEKEPLERGTIYIAPADYHLLIETDHTLSLDDSEKVNFSRPSIDVTFSTAAIAYKQHMMAILLSGANADGVDGLMEVYDAGGKTAVQDPATAEVDYMPKQALEQVKSAHLLTPKDMASFINSMAKV